MALDRVDAAVRKSLNLPQAKPSSERGGGPVTRAAVIARLDAMFEVYRPKFQYTPRPPRTDPATASRFNKDPKTVQSIAKLARFGCIAPVGPLVTGPAASISVAELGDALGFFMSQIAALTYFADPKWTPHLMPPDGG